MDSSLHSHIAGLYLQDRIAEATAARKAPAALEPRPAQRRLRRRAAKPRPKVAFDRTA
jgi:hypothetical protein